MVMTADHDDRVVPAHSFKFISTLQPAQQGDAPVLIRVQTQAGHGAGMPTSMIIDQQADKWAFFFHSMGVTPQYDKSEQSDRLHKLQRLVKGSPGRRKVVGASC
jgi:prolyl oligopeptidase